MRRFLSCLIIFLFTFGLMLTEAEAKRFGGGKSFGVQRSVNNSSFSRPQNLNASPASAANKWLAPLTGLALGGILASLFMGHGLGAGLLSWLLIGGVLLLIVNFIRQRMNPSQPSAAQIKPQPLRDTSAYFRNNAQTYSAQASTPPSGFHADAFLREAKVQFMRLQTAYDSKNLNDLREFTTPEVYAEIQMQLQERGNAVNHTDVVSLNSELLEAITEQQATVASVRFSGMVKEDSIHTPTAFNEVWHFKKESDYARWVVAGIQQN